jgi:nicotinamide-nucleotide amidase
VRPATQAALEALAARIAAALTGRGERLVTAESCTGGWVGQVLTTIPGSSAWFERGFITYSNDAKREMLGVSEDLLARCGAVAEPTAAAMAAGALRASPAEWALAVTGIAGPGGGSIDKPVGTVCFAWSRRDGQSGTLTRRFAGDRSAIRAQSVEAALSGLLTMLGEPVVT